MIIKNLKHKKHIIISNRINIDNDYNDSSLLPFIYLISLKYICLKNPLKRTANELLLRLSN